MRSGQRIGKYVLGEPIARGGMAEVWAAQVEGPGGFVKPLALKFILESFAADPELERLFVNEARLAARLQHANLVAVFDFDRIQESEGALPGRYYIAMERIDGHDLRRVAQAAALRTRRVHPSIALYVAGEVLRGLRYVHERRDEPSGRRLELVHRDVSPHNVLVGMGGEVKLSDFGIAKARALHHTIDTRAGTVRGKLAYAAPEQLRSESLDHRADQFAMGIVLWELLAGRRLFDGASEMEIAEKVLAGEIPPFPAAAGVAPAIEEIVRRMLSARPHDRFPSTAEALNAVMAAPGYRPDPAPLVELMHELFPPHNLPVAPTAPVELPDPLALLPKKQMPPTIPLDMGPGGGAAGAKAAAAGGIAAAGAVTVNRPLFESSGDGSGSYVSDVGASPWSRAARRHDRAAASPARRLIVGFVAVALVGGGLGVAIRRLGAARSTVTGASTPAGTGTTGSPGATAGTGTTAGTATPTPPLDPPSAAPPSSAALAPPDLPAASPTRPSGELAPRDVPGAPRPGTETLPVDHREQPEASGPPRAPTPPIAAPAPPTQPPMARAAPPITPDRAVPPPPISAPLPTRDPVAPPPAPGPAASAPPTPPVLPLPSLPPPVAPAAKPRKGIAPNAAPILE